MILALAAALLFQQPDTLPVFDSPDTERLVIRAIEAVGEVPTELRDYEADVQSTMQITIAADTAGVADLPATVDEVVSTIRWERRGYLHQEVTGHRTRVLVPLPYTLATILEAELGLVPLGGLGIALFSLPLAFALGFALIQGHPFIDGNKRIGHAAMEVFLVLNGFEINASVDEQEAVTSAEQVYGEV